MVCGAPGEIRTPDRLVRSQVLYPAELRALLRSIKVAHYPCHSRRVSRQDADNIWVAEREGFEPSMELLTPYSLSRGAPSANSAISPLSKVLRFNSIYRRYDT